MTYNWQQGDWPNFKYDLSGLEDCLYRIAEKMGNANGMLRGLSDNLQNEMLTELMVSEALKTSEIEGEYIRRADVMSSIRNNLGFNPVHEKVGDKRAEGLAELMVRVRQNYAHDISEDELFLWHKMLMRGARRVKAGAWRTHTEPMQVISGSMGKERIHYEAPPSAAVPAEMKRFIKWFNETAPTGTTPILQSPVRSGIAHLYFETVHPFEDGNGRIGRAISEKALSQGIGRPVLLSLSRTIEADKKSYYAALQAAQRSNEITPWLEYFIDVVLCAQTQAETQIDFTLKKAKLFERLKDRISDRQLTVLRRMLDEGPKGFEGGMTAGKYMKITQASKPTATRDLQDLVEKGALTPIGEGRSRRYDVMI